MFLYGVVVWKVFIGDKKFSLIVSLKPFYWIWAEKKHTEETN